MARLGFTWGARSGLYFGRRLKRVTCYAKGTSTSLSRKTGRGSVKTCALEQRYCPQRLRFPSSKSSTEPFLSFSFFPQGVCLKLCLSPFVLSTLMGLETLGTEIPSVIWCRCAHTLIASLWRSFPRWGWELREDVFTFAGA